MIHLQYVSKVKNIKVETYASGRGNEIYSRLYLKISDVVSKVKDEGTYNS